MSIFESIHIDNPLTWMVPRVQSESDPNYIKHVRCEGARFHVISWHLRNNRAGMQCSEKDCIVNKGYDNEC